MKSKAKRAKRENIFRLGLVALVWTVAIAAMWNPLSKSEAAAGAEDPIEKLYRQPAPDFDLNLTRGLQSVRQATGDQIQALNNLKAATNAPNMTTRWNSFGGSPDVMYDFASQPYSGTPEEAGRAFINQNAGLFGISELNNIRVFSEKQALGGTLIRFQQTFNGVPVTNGGIGIVLNANNQVIMASGPFFRDVSVNTQPSLSADQARQAAATDLARFSVNVPDAVANLLQTGLSALTEQAAPIANLEPQLGVYPTADGYKLVWKVAKFSTNPFGLYMVSVDAHSGEIVERKDFVSYQNPVQPMTADIFPKYPRITDELKNQGIISVCGGKPCDQVRAQLRKFDPSNVVTGLNGTLTGTHTVVNNALATKQPFAQAALGTWHFSKDDPAALEGRTNEQDQFAEPAEHQDEINAFFFTTYLLEYVDHLHRAGDQGTFGSTGSFPDQYPNSSTPLPATVHIPDVLTPLTGGSYPPATDPEFAQKVLGLDNAFALNLTSIIEGVTASKSPVVVNPTSYGHGFYFNDTALEGTVPYHEGMHAITSPIAGLEGTEGGALNEGQADMWAFTITDNASLGDYVVNAYRLRQRYRDLNRDPDSIGYIRSARSSLKYSDIATYFNPRTSAYEYEEHRDGEIYMSTMWDIREMLNRMYPQNTQFKRPRPEDGAASKVITKGTNIFERQFLGSMYILGTTAPDTLVKSRDAMIVADQMLYPSDTTNADSPGKHRALIEQMFAAKELGVNALESVGGKPTISTQVTPFAAQQPAPAVPTNVQAAPASTRTMRITWDGVSGATAYEVLKRKKTLAGQREPNGVRAYSDGDSSTTGYRHVAYVSGSSASYVDEGKVQGVSTPAGIANLFDSEYVVRAIGVNASGQVGFSDMSGSSAPAQGRQDLTAQVDSAISNISFTNGVMSFDNKLTNARGAFSVDKTIYKPLEFQIVSISNPTVTVRNADTGGNTFIYNQTLALGQTSAAKRLEFNDPMAQLFSFDARIYGNAYIGSTVGTGTSGSDGSSEAPGPITYSLFNQAFTGTLVLGDPVGTANGNVGLTWGDPKFKGITWQDHTITTQSDAISLEAALTSSTAVDLDFELRTPSGQILQRSAGATASEFISAAVQPNTTYVLRVLGFANGPATYNIATTQLLPNGSPNANGGTRTSGGSPLGTSAITTPIAGLYRFTVNPLTKSVTFSVLR
jgi:Zn-dependent metalloprotease